MNKINWLLIVGTLCLTGLGRATGSNTALYDFLNLGHSGRVQALGNAYVIAAAGPEAIQANPALLFLEQRPGQIQLGFIPMSYDRQYGYVMYDQPLKNPFTKFGLGYTLMSVSDIDTRVHKYDVATSFVAHDYNFVIALARRVNYNLSVGANLNLLSNNYTQTKNQLFFTFGFHYREAFDLTDLASTFRLYKDMGGVWSFGAHQLLTHRIRLYEQINMHFHETSSETLLKGGFEYLFARDLYIQVGWNDGQWSSGIRFLLNQVRLDYALVLAELGVRHQFSITL